MNYEHFAIAFCPNLFVFIMAGVACYTTLIYAFPQIISQSSNQVRSYIYYGFAIFVFAMFLWCWIYTISADPGRVSDDLEKRGLLDKIKRGDIPYCLQRFKLCSKCQIPMPPNSFHCEICHSCHLRYDHHCGVVGQCIADKNIKSFILSFFYGSIFGIISVNICFKYAFTLNPHPVFELTLSEVLSFIVGIYCALISIFLIGFVFSIIANEAIFLVKNHKNVTFARLFKLFANKWYEIFIPIQKDTTRYAWMEVYWIDDFEL